MTSVDRPQIKLKVNRLKVYSYSFGIYLLVNLIAQEVVTLLENKTHRLLYPIFPFMALWILVVTYIGASHYIHIKVNKPSSKLWVKILKVLLFLIFTYIIIMASWFSVINNDLDMLRKANNKTEKSFSELRNKLMDSQVNSYESE